VSHDRYFLDRVATSILAFEGKGKVTRYPGSYETYRSLRRPAEPPPTAPPTMRSREAAPKVAGPKPLTFGERKELDGILDEISGLEATIKELESRLADPALYTRGPDEAQRLRADHTNAERNLAERTARWEELESRRDVKRS
jgi:ATP-binding cassette subfamily F protein uup